MSLPFAFRDIPSKMFPFTVEFLREDTGEVIHKDTVDGPGVLRVPPVGREHGGVRVAVRVTYADGTEVYAPAMEEDSSADQDH